MKKNILALIMAFAMIFTMALPSYASESGGTQDPAPTYSVTVNPSTEHGTVTAEPTSGVAGTDVTLTVTPDEGYELTSMSGNNVPEGFNKDTRTFKIGTDDVYIYPYFKAINYTVSVAEGISNGSVSLSKETANIGDKITVTATPADGYQLKSLYYGDNVAISTTTKEFTMPASNVVVSAVFEEKDYPIAITCDNSAVTVTAKVGGTAVEGAKSGTMVNVVVENLGERYQVKNYTITTAGNSTPSSESNDAKTSITFEMPASAVTVDVDVEKIQTDLRTITLDCERYGDADIYVNGTRITSSTIEARWDDVVTISVDPDNDYALERLAVTGASGNVDVSYDEDEYCFIMPNENVTIDIDFYDAEDEGPFDLYVDSDDGSYTMLVIGRHSDLALETEFAYKGDSVRLYIEPEAGYVVDDIVAESDVYSPSVQYNEDEDFWWFKMPSDNTDITIYYERDDDYEDEGDGEYEIDVSSSSTRRGDVDVVSYADEDETVKIYIDPDSGYEVYDVEVIGDWSDDDYTVTEKSSYWRFTMPDEDVTIYVYYEETDDDDGYYDIFLLDDEEHGTVDVDDSAESGDTVRIDVDPDYGYEVDEIIVTKFGSSKTVKVTKKSSYWTFEMPSYDVIVEVAYTDDDDDEADGDYLIDLYYDDGYADVDIVDSADASTSVRLYIDLYDDCEVDEITITRSNGKTVNWKYHTSGGYYYFTMPTSDVEIEITFEGEPTDDEEVEEDDGLFDITLEYDEDAGEVDVDSSAEEGEKVYIELDLDMDYELDRIRVFEYSTGEIVSVKKSSSTKYYFTMPEDDVFVIVTFDCDDYEDEDKYYIDIESDDTDMGDASLSISSAAKGERVLIFIDPNSEYAVADIIAERSSNGNVVTVNKLTDFCFDFTMPGSDVDVTVYFDEDKPMAAKDITLVYNNKMGEVYLSDDYAEEDDDVNIFVEPYDGYEIDSVSVKRTVGNKKVTVSKTRTGDYVFEMPNADVTVTVNFKKIEDPKPTTPTTPTTPTEPTVHICPAKPYTDVDTNEWYHEAIDYAIAYNLMTGYSDTIFAPGDNVSRGMIVTVLWRIAGTPASTSPMPYADVAEGQWYTEAVRWAAANGLLTNVASGNYFEPNATITREQFASVIYRYQKLIGGGYTNGWTHPLNFSDLNLMSSWALEPLTWCNEFGILNGVGYDRLDPQGSVTRAQLAQILLNLNNLEK